MHKLTVPAALTLALLLAGCAEPPAEARQRTEEAVAAAREATENSTYAAEEFRAVQVAFNDAEKEIAAQDERFAIMRDYEEAEKLLATAVDKAGAAKAEAAAQKETARQEAGARMAQAMEAVAGAESALASAPRGKGTKADIAALTADLEGLRSQFAQMDERMDGEEYFAARDQADSLISAADSIAQEIETAIATQARILGRKR